MKTCGTCKVLKQDIFFSNSNSTKDKLCRRCKECDSVARKKYYENNTEKELQRKKNWRENNKDFLKEYQQKYQSNNMHRWIEYTNRRRTMALNNGVFYISKNELLKIYNSPCIYCGSLLNITLDHVIPISRGGTHGIGNIAAACKNCNLSKSSKTIMEWRKSLAYYSAVM